jgi:hypothetical protein
MKAIFPQTFRIWFQDKKKFYHPSYNNKVKSCSIVKDEKRVAQRKHVTNTSMCAREIVAKAKDLNFFSFYASALQSFCIVYRGFTIYFFLYIFKVM